MTDTERERINAICEVAGVAEIDDLSDGFHTFRQLYYQRMMLFATIVKQNKDKAWKSLRHEDGELCFGGGWFIVGIDTPEGSYTYHYENKYFDLFDCEILDYGKHWDGHTEKDVTRLLSLPKAQLSCEGTTKDTTSDLISKTETVERLRRVLDVTVPITDYDGGYVDGVEVGISTVSTMPTIQPQSTTGQLNDGARSTAQSNDLIDRQAAIRWVKTECNPYGKPTLDFESGKKVIEHLLHMPPAQPEPEEGRWITDGNGNAYCSECGLHTTEDVLRRIALVGEDKPKFCSNCGTRMKGE